MGALSRDILAATLIPNLSAAARNPIAYEVGQLTVPGRIHVLYKSLSAVERGKALIANHGFLGLPRLMMEALAEGAWHQTIGTGTTPAVWIIADGIVDGMDRYFAW